MKKQIAFWMLSIAALLPAAEKKGVLLLAHGGRQNWNEEVERLAAEVNRRLPVEVAFGMATKANIQQALDRLTARGVSEVVAVPLFVSSHSSVITATEFLLGLRAEAPPQLKLFARMNHHSGSGPHHHAPASEATADDGTTPVSTPARIRMAPAINRHPLAASILVARAQSISRDPAREVVVLVAHGPVTDEENAQWLADMAALAGRMRESTRFHRIEALTVRDDAPEPIRSQAAEELRSVVKRAAAEGKRALIVPLLISFGGIEEGIRKRLDGLEYEMAGQGLLPDPRLAEWVLAMAAGGEAR